MPNEILEPLTVRIETAKKITGWGETFIRDRINDGTLKSKTVGRTRVINYASLKALVA